MSKHEIKEIAEFLNRVPLFKTLSPKELTTIASRVREREYLEGDVIVEQGKPGIGLYIIVNGLAKVVRQHQDGTETVIDHISRFGVFGELTLLTDSPRSASVVAAEPMFILVLPKLDFLDELEAQPQMAIEMLKELATRFHRLVTSL